MNRYQLIFLGSVYFSIHDNITYLAFTATGKLCIARLIYILISKCFCYRIQFIRERFTFFPLKTPS